MVTADDETRAAMSPRRLDDLRRPARGRDRDEHEVRGRWGPDARRGVLDPGRDPATPAGPWPRRERRVARAAETGDHDPVAGEARLVERRERPRRIVVAHRCSRSKAAGRRGCPRGAGPAIGHAAVLEQAAHPLGRVPTATTAGRSRRRRTRTAPCRPRRRAAGRRRRRSGRRASRSPARYASRNRSRDRLQPRLEVQAGRRERSAVCVSIARRPALRPTWSSERSIEATSRSGDAWARRSSSDRSGSPSKSMIR